VTSAEPRRRARRGRPTPEEVTPAPATLAEEPASERQEGRRPPRRARAGGSTLARFLRENARMLSAVVLFGTGILLVTLGWYGAARTNILTEQIPYLISGGLLGLGLIVVAGSLVSSVGLERENRELRRQLERAVERASAGGQPRLTVVASNPGEEATVLVVPGGRSHHVAGCPIVEGKATSELPLAEAVASGYGTCKLCGPD
jgi:hypothetical protein